MSLRKTAFGLSGVLLGLLVIEAGLRLAFVARCRRERVAALSGTRGIVDLPQRPWREYDPLTGWRNKPGAFVPDYVPGAEARIGPQGLRGAHDYSARKRPGVYRVLLLGDSVPFGYGVSDEETMARSLEREIPGLEVLDMGVSAFGLDQTVLLYERDGRRFQADMVMLAMPAQSLFRRNHLYVWPYGGYERPRFVLDGGTLRLTNVPVPAARGAAGLSQWTSALLSPRPFLWDIIQVRLARRALRQPAAPDELGAALLERLRRDAAADGARFSVVFCPERDRLHDDDDPVRSYLRDFARRSGSGLIDLTPDFARRDAAAPAESLFWDVGGGRVDDDAVHWSRRGNALAAKVVGAYLRRAMAGDEPVVKRLAAP